MKLFGCPQIATILTILFAACCVSCKRPASTTTTAAKPGPEETLTQIMDIFKRRMEDTPIGFVATDSTGRSAMTGTNKVSYDLVRPASDGKPFKAVVTVKSHAHYSILRTAERPKEDTRDKEAKDRSVGAVDETDPDVAAFDSDESQQAAEESPKQKKSATRPGEESVARQKVDEVRTYELIYENGRWRLMTKLNEQTEKATENAFNNALNTQI